MKKLFAVLVALLLVAPPLAYANQHQSAEDLPDAGTTPDSIFYGLERASESISLALTFSPNAKAEKHLQLAEERLAEAQAVSERNRSDLAARSAEDYDSHVSSANSIAESAPDARDKEELSSLVGEATSRHITVLDSVKQRVPPEARDSIERAQENSIRGNQEALRALAESNGTKAAEMAMDVASGRAEAASRAADRNDTNETTDAAEEYGEYAGFGQEVADIAQNAGQNATAVQEIVATATQHHITVLEDVLERVPEEARQGIETALQNARTGRQRAMENLPEGTPTGPGEQAGEAGGNQTAQEQQEAGTSGENTTEGNGSQQTGGQQGGAP